MTRRRDRRTGWVPLVALGVATLACDPEGLGRSNPNFLVVGHHGAPNLAPENTVRGFRASMAVGANAMEIDLCVTKDDIVVAFHDRDPDSTVALARQAGGEGYDWLPYVPPVGSPWRKPVHSLTLAELLEYYGYRNANGGRDTSAEIPTLAQVLDWASSESALRAIYFDLKFDGSELAAGPQVLREVWEAARADEALRGVTFLLLTVHESMIDALEAEQARLGASDIRIVWDYEQTGALDATLGKGLRDVSTGLTPSITWHEYKREIADAVDARESGRIDSVLSWTFDKEMQLAELLYYSVDGVITNDPATLNRMWQESLE